MLVAALLSAALPGPAEFGELQSIDQLAVGQIVKGYVKQTTAKGAPSLFSPRLSLHLAFRLCCLFTPLAIVLPMCNAAACVIVFTSCAFCVVLFLQAASSA
jgi:hypothetical protein